MTSEPETPASGASHLSERAAQIEAAALELAAQLAGKQRELNKRRREAALAAKAALVDQMKASIAEIDDEIQVGTHVGLDGCQLLRLCLQNSRLASNFRLAYKLCMSAARH